MADLAAPHVDPVLGLTHGERDPEQGDPEPITVPGTSARYCLCGHPLDDHDANECWWDVSLGVQSDDPREQCPCSWISPAEDAT